MKIGFSQPEIIPTLPALRRKPGGATTLRLPTKGFGKGRVAHAYHLVEANKVMEVDDGIFRVRSQYQPHKSYLVNINGGHPSCDCPDGQRTINCKHRLASLLIASQGSQRRLRREIDALTVTDETHKSCNHRGRWIVTDDQDKAVYHIYRDGKGRLICPCGRKSDCKHRKAIKEYISKNKIKNECSTEFALEIQAKLNRHLNRLTNSTKGPVLERSEGSKDPSQLAKRNATRQLLPLTEMEVEQPVEIGAIEKKVQLEAEFDWQTAYQKCRKAAGTQANVDITINELVKTGKLRHDKKSHYNRTEWLIIYHACKDDNDDGGGEKPPSSNPDLVGIGWKEKFRECKNAALNDTRFNWIKTDLMREKALRKAYPRYWTDNDFDLLKRACALDTSLFNRRIGEHWVIQKEDNFNHWDYSRRYRFWMVTKDTHQLREKCFCCGKTKVQVSQLYDYLIYWERYHIKTVICSGCLKATTKEDMTRRFDQLYHQTPGAVKTKGLPKPSEKFLQDFRDKLAQVRQGGDEGINKS